MQESIVGHRSLLSDSQGRHISHGPMSRSFQIKHHDRCLIGLELDSRVLGWLHRWGLYGALKLSRLTLDCQLITAMIERWRPETRTFFLVAGEATITLSDVSILTGLPICGRPIIFTGSLSSLSRRQFSEYCLRKFGWAPSDSEITKGSFQFRPLASHIQQTHITPEHSDEDALMHARAIALMVVTGVMFPGTGGDRASTQFIELFDDEYVIGDYSWGSAVLALLYREMSLAAFGDRVTLGGFMRLPLVWAYAHMPSLAPKLTRRHPGDQWEIDSRPIYSWRWLGVRNKTGVAAHSLGPCREALSMTGRSDGFLWQPYGLDEIYSHAASTQSRWLSDGPLIFHYIVECHPIERVLRQIKGSIVIPSLPSSEWRSVRERHDRERDVDYSLEHGTWVERWNLGVPLIEDTLLHVSMDEYYRWYDLITPPLFIATRQPHVEGWQAGVPDHLAAGVVDWVQSSQDPTHPPFDHTGFMTQMATHLYQRPPIIPSPPRYHSPVDPWRHTESTDCRLPQPATYHGDSSYGLSQAEFASMPSYPIFSTTGMGSTAQTSRGFSTSAGTTREDALSDVRGSVQSPSSGDRRRTGRRPSRRPGCGRGD